MSLGLREQIKAMASELALDEQATGLTCPQCKGGASGESSFSVRKNIVSANYFCHRSSCDLRGTVNMIGTLGSGPLSTEPPKAKRLVEFAGKLEPLPDKVVEYIQEKWQMDSLSILKQGIQWSPEWDNGGGRIAMPINSRLGARIGFVFRTMLPGVKPKTINYLSSAYEVCMSWYPWTVTGNRSCFKLDFPVVIVEDSISAMRASNVCNAIALLGTNMSDVKLAEIQRAKPKEVIIALDADAQDRAVAMVRKLQGLFESVTLRTLKKDLKDSSDMEIRNVLNVDRTIA